MAKVRWGEKLVGDYSSLLDRMGRQREDPGLSQDSHLRSALEVPSMSDRASLLPWNNHFPFQFKMVFPFCFRCKEAQNDSHGQINEVLWDIRNTLISFVAMDLNHVTVTTPWGLYKMSPAMYDSVRVRVQVQLGALIPQGEVPCLVWQQWADVAQQHGPDTPAL